jgi:hypothetical protein
MIDVSVIIVSWNARDYLMDCLQSLISKNSISRTEIIVIDNASNDHSPDAVRERYPFVKLIRNETNRGFAAANNIGIGMGRGRYVCLVNSDVRVLNGCIDRLCSYMDQNPSIGMLAPRILNADLTLQPSVRRFPTLWSSLCRALALDTFFSQSGMSGGEMMAFGSEDKSRSVDVLSGCFMMVRRGAIEQVGVLDENFFIYAEDIDWCRRFRQAGWDVVYYPGAQAIHYGDGSSSNAPIKFFIEMQKANLQYWKKHHGLTKQVAYFLITFFHQILRIAGNSVVYTFKPSARTTIIHKLKRSIACTRWLLRISVQ